jgi:hypothetical protein
VDLAIIVPAYKVRVLCDGIAIAFGLLRIRRRLRSLEQAPALELAPTAR